MKAAREQWSALTAEEKTAWNNLALSKTGVSGYNLFIQNYFTLQPTPAIITYDQRAYGTFNYQ